MNKKKKVENFFKMNLNRWCSHCSFNYSQVKQELQQTEDWQKCFGKMCCAKQWVALLQCCNQTTLETIQNHAVFYSCQNNSSVFNALWPCLQTCYCNSVWQQQCARKRNTFFQMRANPILMQMNRIMDCELCKHFVVVLLEAIAIMMIVGTALLADIIG